jgi:hypothetical protein
MYLTVKNILLFILVVTLIAGCGVSPPDDILEKSGQASLVFVKENSQDNNRSSAMRSNADEYYPGTDLYVLSPISIHGSVTNLTSQYTKAGQSQSRNYGAAEDPEVSYDGKKILFAMKANRNTWWHLYEMNTDGTELLQLTDQSYGDDMDPAYLPNGQIIFTSTRSGIVDEYERRDSPLLHVADRTSDGRLTNIRQISFNQSHDTNPFVHSSGKVIYSRWEHLGNPNKFPLFVINPDGTRPFILYGNHSPRESGSRTFLEARELADGGLVSSVMERNSPFEGGAIAIIDISKSDDNLEFISPPTVPFNNTNLESSALYKTPFPIFDDGREEKIIVSVSPIPVNSENEESVDYGLYVMNKDGSNLQLLYNDPDYNDIDPVAILPREDLPGGVPRIIPMDPNVVEGLNSGATTGMFFDGNVYHRSPSDGQRRPDANMVTTNGTSGEAKYLRVLEAIGLPQERDNRGGPIGETNFEKQRVVGYALIRSDGSFSIEVPANKSLHVQTLDENGLMLVNQMTWIQVMPGEKRLCTGCHDSHDRDKIINDLNVTTSLDVENTSSGYTYNSGFNNATMVSAHPAARTDTVDFCDRYLINRTNTVQQVIDESCISCHGLVSPSGGLVLQNRAEDLAPPGDDMEETTSVYVNLTSAGYTDPDGEDMDYVDRNGAKNSPLLWVLFGKQLNRTDNWDYRNLTYDHTQMWQRNTHGIIDPFLPTNKGLLTLIEWVDAGIQYSNTIDE